MSQDNIGTFELYASSIVMNPTLAIKNKMSKPSGAAEGDFSSLFAAAKNLAATASNSYCTMMVSR